MSLIEHIKHYQRSIDRSEHDRDRIVYCLGKLYSMPITVDDLKKTGIGKTVNALRKWDGEAGEVARALIGKWRDMVEAEDDDVEEEEEENVADSGNEDDYRETEEEDNDAVQHHDGEQDDDNDEDDEEEQPQEEEERHQEKEYRKYKRESNQEDVETESKHRKYYSEDDNSSNEKYNKNEHEKSDTTDTSRTSSRERSEHKSKSKDRHHKEHKHREKGLKRKNNQERQDETDDSQFDTKETNDERRSKTKDKRRDHNKDKHSKSDRHKHSSSSSSSSKKDKHNDDASHSSKQNNTKSDKHNNKSKHRETSSRYEEESSEENVKETSKIQVPSVSSSNHHSDKSKHHSSKDHKSSKRIRNDKNLEKQSKKLKIKDSEIEGINSYSGASFAEALGMMDESVSYSTPKKKSAPSSVASSNNSNQSSKASTSTAIPKPDLLAPGIKLPNLDLDITLPTISTNYKPLPHEFERKPSHRPLGISQEEALEIVMSSKNQRTKVFSGNKCSAGVVSSLYDSCIRVLQENIDALEYTGGVPYCILLPILERATPEQLFQLEHHNAYLLEDTDELWQQHCIREFRNRKREELESWREAYSRFITEREAKLRALTANIKQNQVEKLAPVRQTKLAYVDSVVKPPRSIARKQAKMGTGSACNAKPLISPAARAAALSTAGATVAVPNPGRAAAPSTSNLKPKKAPLMQKMLTQIKKTNRYRR